MAYTKTTWVNDSEPAISADNLQKMEVGIAEAHDHVVLTNNPHTVTLAQVGAAASGHDHSGVYEPADATIIRQSDVDDEPVNGVTTSPVSSNWAYDHAASHAPANADNTASNETSHADVVVDGDIGVSVAAHSHNHDAAYAPISVTNYASTIIILSKSSSVSQDVGGANDTEVWWTWDGEVRKDTGFTHSTETNPSRITVSATGWYKISFMGNAQQTGSARTTLQGIYRIDGGSTIRSGSIRDYTRGNAYGNVSPGLVDIVQVTSGSYIEVGTRVEDTDATYTITAPDGTEVTNDENRLIIELVP